MFFPMLADVYYPVKVQKPSGAMEANWEFDQSVPCELKTGSFNTSKQNALQTFDDLFALPMLVYGRFDRDIQILQDESSVPFSELRITNIRTRTCDDTGLVLFNENIDGGMVPTVYEVHSLSPFINPWGVAEHFKTQLVRSDDQKGAL